MENMNTEKETITVIVIPADKAQAEVREIPKGFQELQKLVNGTFDIVSPACYLPAGMQESALAKYDLFVNDEGILLHMLPNICINRARLLAKDYDYAGILFGNVVIAGHDEEGNTTSIDLDDLPELVDLIGSLMLYNDERANAGRSVTL